MRRDIEGRVLDLGTWLPGRLVVETFAHPHMKPSLRVSVQWGGSPRDPANGYPIDYEYKPTAATARRHAEGWHRWLLDDAHEHTARRSTPGARPSGAQSLERWHPAPTHELAVALDAFTGTVGGQVAARPADAFDGRNSWVVMVVADAKQRDWLTGASGEAPPMDPRLLEVLQAQLIRKLFFAYEVGDLFVHVGAVRGMQRWVEPR